MQSHAIKSGSGFRLKGRYRIIGTKDGVEVINTGWIQNLIMLSDGYGLNLVLRALRRDSTYPLGIIKAKMGTSTTAPTAGDTDLVAPTVDDILPYVSTISGAADSVLTIKFFASDSDVPDDTYNEFGIYCGDVLAAARIFTRSIITPAYVKAAGVDTTVEYEIEAFNT